MTNKNNYILSYEKIYGKSYINICENTTCDFKDSDFTIRMITENHIPGILQCHTNNVDNSLTFSYEITSLQSLAIILESVSLTEALLKKLIEGIYNCLFSGNEYMLDWDKFLLSEDVIFVSSDFSTVKLCYYPLYTGNIHSSIKTLSDYLLKKIDHLDKGAVYLGYTLHKACQQEDFSALSLPSFIESSNNSSDTPSDNPFNVSSCNSASQLLKKPSDNIPVVTQTNSNTQIFSKPVDDIPLITPDHNNLYELKKTRSKIIILSICAAISLISCLSCYICGIISLKFSLCLLFILVCIIAYSGYNLYKDIHSSFPALNTDPFNDPTFLKDSTSLKDLTSLRASTQKKESDSKKEVITAKEVSVPTDCHVFSDTETVLLSSPENSDFHKLTAFYKDKYHEVMLTHYPFTFGKSSACDEIIDNPAVSRLHARIINIPDSGGTGHYYLEDLNSTNGTCINNKSLTPYEPCPLKPLDHISLGDLTYTFV